MYEDDSWDVPMTSNDRINWERNPLKPNKVTSSARGRNSDRRKQEARQSKISKEEQPKKEKER